MHPYQIISVPLLGQCCCGNGCLRRRSLLNPHESTVPASLRVRGHGPDPVPDVDRAAQRRKVVHVMRVVVPLAPHNAAVAHDVLVVAEVDVVAVRVLTVVAERPDLDRPVPRAGHDGLVTVVRPVGMIEVGWF